MAIPNTTFRIFVEKLGAVEATEFIGNEGDLFYDPNSGELRLSDGSTPGGTVVSSFSTGGGGVTIVASNLVGTNREIDVVSAGSSSVRATLSNDLLIPGSLDVSGITTLAMDGSDTFTGGNLTVRGKVRAVRYSTVSDERLKTNIRKITKPLDVLSNINGVMFDWISDNSPDVGIIAQDVERVLPNAVQEIEETKSVNYNGLVGLLVEAVKELSLENKSLKYDIESIKTVL